jgi:hypothetical protein
MLVNDWNVEIIDILLPESKLGLFEYVSAASLKLLK